MTDPNQDNIVFSLAADFIHHTSRSVFLTGKAGTGKTTLLKHICETTNKRCVVVAPTGVAAINAGGVTIHSFFNIPPGGPIIPESSRSQLPQNVIDRHSLFRQIRFSEEKRDLIQDLELLIIDEVSMVRCDLLDAMDTILRSFRKKHHQPFGGVQVLCIGDLFQLPPVVRGEEWNVLREFYSTPYFFGARSFEQSPFLYLELKKVYRQNEQRFIDVLNQIRNNEVNQEDLEMLHERYMPDFRPPADEQYITLTTHNYKADAINQEALKNLPGKKFVFRATVEGEFPDHLLPLEMELSLKEEAQVMFIRNDTKEGLTRYYNGKIAVVSKIDGSDIYVRFPDSGLEMKLEKETWKNTRFTYNREEERVEDEELGTFVHYPIRLAWAITVHKSQGLTFQKAIIDPGDSFAPGQVYVALSRCTSLQGMVLRSKINLRSISVDPGIVAFSMHAKAEEELLPLLQKEKRLFLSSQLLQLFDFDKLIRTLDEYAAFLPGKKIKDEEKATLLARQMQQKIKELDEVAGKFRPQFEKLIAEADLGETAALRERTLKAISYFSTEIGEGLLAPLNEHMTAVGKKTKKYQQQLRVVKAAIVRKLERMKNARYHDMALADEDSFQQLEAASKSLTVPVSSGKREKGASQKETLAAFREGRTVEQIAEGRNLSPVTIEGHLAEFVKTGELDVKALMSEEKLNAIFMVLNQVEGTSLIPVKEKLGKSYSYGEIKAAVNYREYLKSVNEWS